MLGEICYTTAEKGDKGLAKTITTMVLLLAGSLLFGAAPRPADVAPDAEVWLCAGQSNMAMTLAETTSAAEEAARTAACDIRYHDFRTGAWLRVTPENAGGLSALAVQFATRRAEQTKRPQALVYVAAGGAPTEAFLARATMLRKDAAGAFLYPQLAKIASNTNTLDRNDDFPCLWCKREYPRRKNNAHEGALWAVSALHAALAATRSLPVTGVLWYQGESNATTCVAPDTALPRDYMEETLRAVLEELSPNHRTPVFMFGLPKMDRPWETYRAAQQKVCAETGHVFLDTFAAGLGTPGNVHPPDKRPFAELAVQAAAEHVKGVDLFRSETAYNDKIVKFYRIHEQGHVAGGDRPAAGCGGRPQLPPADAHRDAAFRGQRSDVGAAGTDPRAAVDGRGTDQRVRSEPARRSGDGTGLLLLERVGMGEGQGTLPLFRAAHG